MTARDYLRVHDFRGLFNDLLGWCEARKTHAFVYGGREYRLEAIARGNELTVVSCVAPELPISRTKFAEECSAHVWERYASHLLILASSGQGRQNWRCDVEFDDGTRYRCQYGPFFSQQPPADLVKEVESLRMPGTKPRETSVVSGPTEKAKKAAAQPSAPRAARRIPPPRPPKSTPPVSSPKNQEEFIAFSRELATKFAARALQFAPIDRNDAEQIAMLGVLEAARRYQPERCHRPSGFAFAWVRNAFQYYAPRSLGPLMLPTSVYWTCHRLHRTVDETAIAEGVSDRRRMIERAAETESDVHSYWRLFESAIGQATSDERLDELQSRDSDPFTEWANAEAKTTILSIVDRLEPRRRRIVRLYYGMDGEPKTLRQIGAVERVSKERVRQLLESAQNRLREVFEEEIPEAVPRRGIAPGSGQDDD